MLKKKTQSFIKRNTDFMVLVKPVSLEHVISAEKTVLNIFVNMTKNDLG